MPKDLQFSIDFHKFGIYKLSIEEKFDAAETSCLMAETLVFLITKIENFSELNSDEIFAHFYNFRKIHESLIGSALKYMNEVEQRRQELEQSVTTKSK